MIHRPELNGPEGVYSHTQARKFHFVDGLHTSWLHIHCRKFSFAMDPLHFLRFCVLHSISIIFQLEYCGWARWWYPTLAVSLPAEKYRKQCVPLETRYFIDSFHSRFVRFDSSVPNDETTRVINDDDLFSSDDRETQPKKFFCWNCESGIKEAVSFVGGNGLWVIVTIFEQKISF